MYSKTNPRSLRIQPTFLADLREHSSSLLAHNFLHFTNRPCRPVHMTILAQPNALIQSGNTTCHAPILGSAPSTHPIGRRLEAGLLAVHETVKHQIATTLCVRYVVQLNIGYPLADRVLKWSFWQMKMKIENIRLQLVVLVSYEATGIKHNAVFVTSYVVHLFNKKIYSVHWTGSTGCQ